MLQYQHSTVRVRTHFIAQTAAEVLPDPLTGTEPLEYFLGPDWQVKTFPRPTLNCLFRSCKFHISKVITAGLVLIHCNDNNHIA